MARLTTLANPEHSTYREQLVEYLFVSELLQDAWLRRRQTIDVLRADVDSSGVDLVLECDGILRHLQLKSSIAGAKTGKQSVHVGLSEKPAGCVVWVELEPGDDRRIALRFLVLGDAGRGRLSMGDFPVQRHTKGNAQGIKNLRKSVRSVPRRAFVPVASISALSDWLFGPPSADGASG